MRYVRGSLAGFGLAAIVYAVAGMVTDPGTHLVGQLIFLAGVLIGHDLIAIPIALGVGAVIARWAPAWLRGPLCAALFASTVVTLVALPFVTGAGHSMDNPSALPLHYGQGLLIVLAAIWFSAAVAVILRLRRSRDHAADDR